CASLEASALFDFGRQRVSNPAQPHVPKFVLFAATAFEHLGIAGQFGSFCDDDHAEIAPAIMPAYQDVRYFLHVEWTLGNQDHVCASGNAAVGGNPAGIASHDLNHNYAVMGFRSGMNPVNSFCGNADGGIKTETEIRAAQIVVYRFRDSYEFDAALKELFR